MAIKLYIHIDYNLTNDENISYLKKKFLTIITITKLNTVITALTSSVHIKIMLVRTKITKQAFFTSQYSSIDG